MSFILLFSRCIKDFPEENFNSPNEVFFTLMPEDGTLKSGENCAWEVDYAMAIISSGKEKDRKTNTYFLPTYIENGVLYTEALELPKLKKDEYYVLEEMILYADDDISQDNPGGDRIISAVPHDGSKFGEMAKKPVNVQFEVDAFNKTEVGLSVFCFDGADPEDFGFVWFQPSVTVIKQKWFFGDLCSDIYEEYTSSLYEIGGVLSIDMPAIFYIDLYRDNNHDGIFYEDEKMGNFGNEENYISGITAPVPVFYSDDTSAENHFELRIFVYVKLGDNFGYQKYGSLYFEDDSEILYKTTYASRNLQYDEAIEHGDDNIYEFVIGNCNSESADFSFGQ